MENRPLMFEIKQLQKHWREYMRKIAAGLGIPDPYCMIIMYLARHPGASQKELAEHCQKTGAAISQTIKEMQYSDYVTKCADEHDLRYTKLYLTDKGENCAGRVREQIHRADRVITAAITPEKEKEIIGIIHLLKETIQKEL